MKPQPPLPPEDARQQSLHDVPSQPPKDSPPAPPPSRLPPAPDAVASKRPLALIIAASAVVAAVLGGRAAYLSDNGGDTWQTAVRDEVKQAASVVETLRYVYQTEAPLAYALTRAEVRLEEFQRGLAGAKGLPRAALSIEVGAQKELIGVLREAAFIAEDDTYRLEGGGFDLIKRVADDRARFGELRDLDPDDNQRAGDELVRQGIYTLAATFPVALAFAAGALGQAFVRARRWMFAVAALLLVVGIAAGVFVEVRGV